MSSFHSSKEWVALAKIHKLIQKAKGKYYCVDCKTINHLESDHILPVSKYPMYGLWLCNLALRCGPEAKGCNQKKSDKIYWSIRAVQLLVIYGMIKILSYIAKGLVIFILIRFLWLDHQYNASIITDHIKADINDAYEWVDGIQLNQGHPLSVDGS